MQTINKGGDVLASGATRNQFPPAGGAVSQEKWDEIFKDYNPTESSEKPKERKYCGCREYPEYGDACLLQNGHKGPHDWQKKGKR